MLNIVTFTKAYLRVYLVESLHLLLRAITYNYIYYLLFVRDSCSCYKSLVIKQSIVNQTSTPTNIYVEKNQILQ